MSSPVNCIRFKSYERPADPTRALAYDLAVELDEWLYERMLLSRVARRLERFNYAARKTLFTLDASLENALFHMAPRFALRAELDLMRVASADWPTDRLVRAIDHTTAPARDYAVRIRNAVADVHEQSVAVSEWLHRPMYSTIEIGRAKP